MTAITLDRLTKRFGAMTALDRVSMEIEEGSFVALLGPSGCGKTTLLRMIAGLETTDGGTISFGGRVVASESVFVPPETRKVAMVFQSYALWPHMSVAENVAYPLGIAGASRADRDRAVEHALEAVGLTGMGGRLPDTMSGGQRQRVALARALVQDAPLVLCDEPLANLDPHLRATMIEAFRKLHRETGRTFVYVTHDQAEALAMATKVAVFDHGKLLQIGTPQEIYQRPASRMVAGFVGHGALISGEVVPASNGTALAANIAGTLTPLPDGAGKPGPALIMVRPESVSLRGPDAVNGLRAQVSGVTYRGAIYEIGLTLPDGQQLIAETRTPPVPGEAVAIAIDHAWAVPAE